RVNQSWKDGATGKRPAVLRSLIRANGPLVDPLNLASLDMKNRPEKAAAARAVEAAVGGNDKTLHENPREKVQRSRYHKATRAGTTCWQQGPLPSKVARYLDPWESNFHDANLDSFVSCFVCRGAGARRQTAGQWRRSQTDGF